MMKSYSEAYQDELEIRMKLAGMKVKDRPRSESARMAGDYEDYDTKTIDQLSQDDLSERLSRMRSAQKYG